MHDFAAAQVDAAMCDADFVIAIDIDTGAWGYRVSLRTKHQAPRLHTKLIVHMHYVYVFMHINLSCIVHCAL